VHGLAARPIASAILTYSVGVDFVVPSPDGLLFAVLTEDGYVELRSLGGFEIKQKWKAHDKAAEAAAYNGNGRWIATAGQDGLAKIWDARTGVLAQTFRVGDIVRSVAFNGDDSLLLTSSDIGTADIWSVASGERLSSFPCADSEAGTDPDNRIAAHAAQFSPNGKYMAVGCNDGAVNIWDIRAHILKNKLVDRSSPIWSVAYSPNGEKIAASAEDGTVRLWTDTGQPSSPEDRRSAEPIIIDNHLRVKSIRFSHDGLFILGASDNATAIIWDTETGRQLQVLRGHKFYVMSAEFTQNNKQVITASWDRDVRIWDLSNDEIDLVSLPQIGVLLSADWDPSERQFVVGSETGFAIINDTGSVVRRTTLGQPVYSVAYSGVGRLVATASSTNYLEDGNIALWDVDTGKIVHTFPTDKSGVTHVSFSKNGDLLLIADGDGVIPIAGAKDYGIRYRLLPSPDTSDDLIDNAVFTPQGDKIVTATNRGLITIWNTRTQKSLKTITNKDRPLNSLRVSLDGLAMAAGFKDGGVSIYSTNSGLLLNELPVQSSAVEDADISPDGRKIVTVLKDGTATVFEISTGKPLETYINHDYRQLETNEVLLPSARFSPDGKRIALFFADGSVRMWAPRIHSFEELTKRALPARRLKSAERTEFVLPCGDDRAC
jgi:WD40 repeat protein